MNEQEDNIMLNQKALRQHCNHFNSCISLTKFPENRNAHWPVVGPRWEINELVDVRSVKEDSRETQITIIELLITKMNANGSNEHVLRL